MMKNHWLRVRLRLLKLTQDDLAARLKSRGITRTRQTIANWERGSPIPLLCNPQDTKILAQSLDWTVTEMLVAAGYDIQISNVSIEPRVLRLAMLLQCLDKKRFAAARRTILFIIGRWEQVSDDEMRDLLDDTDSEDDDDEY